MGGKVESERISSWIGRARLNDHLHIPKSERKSDNIEKKDGSQTRKGKKRSKNQGVTGLVQDRCGTAIEHAGKNTTEHLHVHGPDADVDVEVLLTGGAACYMG